MTVTNRNALWSKTFVDELARQGVAAVCIAPGSRSTPLVFAFAQNGSIKKYSHLDERSAAYFALGLARATGRPVAVVCTSGTAAANFFPAIIEANYSEVPLLVMTADRPHELRESGANQTIDQIRLYGGHVRWFVDVAPPEGSPAPKMVPYLQTLAARAVATALGVIPGPVHLNFPFRKPLEPTPGERQVLSQEQEGDPEIAKPFVSFHRGETIPTDDQVAALVSRIQSVERGLIVCGPRCPDGNFPLAISELARLTGYPLFADALSGVRIGSHVKDAEQSILGAYESYLAHKAFSDGVGPELIIHMGDVPTSKHLNEYLARQPGAHRIHVSHSGRWHDDTFHTTEFLQMDATILCQRLAAQLERRTTWEWNQIFQNAEASAWNTLEEWDHSSEFEANVLRNVVAAMPERSVLYVANSLPVRHLDQFVKPIAKEITIYANRGASGIDGTVSSALGAAAQSEGRTVLVSGDLAFYHDMNGLLAAKRHNIPMTSVVINNNGGGIFHRLPVSEFEPIFTDHFLTPHGLRFEHAASLYEMEYTLVEDGRDLQDHLLPALSNQKSNLIEVLSDSAAFERERRAYLAAVAQRMQIKMAPI